MPLALLCGAWVGLLAGRHGVRDARAGCLWLLDRVCSSVAAATGVASGARAASTVGTTVPLFSGPLRVGRRRSGGRPGQAVSA